MRVENAEIKNIDIRFKPLNGAVFRVDDNGELIVSCNIPYRADVYAHEKQLCGASEIMALDGTFAYAGSRYDTQFIVSYMDNCTIKNDELFSEEKRLWLRQTSALAKDEERPAVESKAS